MATKVGRCLSIYSRSSSISLLRPATKVAHKPAYVTSPGSKWKWTTRWYSDDTVRFNEPAEGYRYTKTHEWASIDGTTAMLGVSNYAQEKLGDVVFVELPEIGTELSQGDQLGVLESVKAAADINSPLSGRVVEVNTALEDEPELINKDPYKEGWIAKLGDVTSSEYDTLLSVKDYEEHLKEAV